MYDEMLKIIKDRLKGEGVEDFEEVAKSLTDGVWAVAVARIESIKAELEAGLKSAVDDMEWE